MKFESILDAVGRTPLVRLGAVGAEGPAALYAKLEFLNPGGSGKDRAALRMVSEAERRGDLRPGGTIVEASTGNAGASLAMAACRRGYHAIVTVPDKHSPEKAQMLRALGAEVIVCPAAVAPEDERSFLSVAKKLAREVPNAWLAGQFENPDNAAAHAETTGPEIWQDTQGKVTHVICPMGSGGTVTGVGRALKERNSKVRVIGVDPEGSVLWDHFHGGRTGARRAYKLEGIGCDFVPPGLDWKVVDDVVRVSDKEAFAAARKLARKEGIFAGGSSGAAVEAALKVLPTTKPGQLVVVVLPDGGAGYSSRLYDEGWMRDHRFLEAGLDLTCGDILRSKPSRGLVSVEPHERASEALRKVREADASQLPVLERGIVIGTVYEDALIELVMEGKEIKLLIVREIMGEPLPVVGRETTLEELTRHIPHRVPAVLVEVGEGGYDIITKYDLVRTVGEAAESGRL